MAKLGFQSRQLRRTTQARTHPSITPSQFRAIPAATAEHPMATTALAIITMIVMIRAAQSVHDFLLGEHSTYLLQLRSSS